ncbi:MAG: tRNA 2-thiouridine(34) synthase MnmA [Epulopiscium sp. Nuni2H_MBin003]|nr:MAG: tRNA 2-thiouridine(34) synthase MnmA [Epulopiscium sp. Nuni2H_MBin003]
MAKKVVVGMSGGVDSSVAAYLLKKAGYEVIGVTMQIWQKDDNAENSCCGLSAIDDARRVAQMIDIPHYVMNFRDDFKKNVIEYFVDEYKIGRTPNPCIACNRYVKWESLLTKSLQIGADFIATGHYANIVENAGRYQLKQSKTLKKDQTYALYNLTQHQLKHTLMPLGEYTKEEVREIAKEIGLLVANKPDSQEICFVTDNNYANYIEQLTDIKSVRGNFIDKDGKVLGKHKGIINYTIGQRKGLGIAFGKPTFVTKINAEDNTITLGDDMDLFTNTIYATNPNFMAFDNFEGEIKALGKIRYSHKPSPCTVNITEDKLKFTFSEPQRAPTPGQAIVFYQDDLVIGGATIM